MEFHQYIAAASFALTVLMALLGGFRYVSVMADTLKTMVLDKHEAARLTVERNVEKESKLRHDLANEVTNRFSEITRELRDLQRGAVRHEQMQAVEARMHMSLSKIEVKVDKLTEAAAEIASMRGQMNSIAGRVDKVLERMEVQGHHSRG